MNRIIFIALIFGLLLISCQQSMDECLCTDEFLRVTVVVVDTLMDALDSVSVQTINKKTNEPLQVNQEQISIAGTYVVIDDSHIGELSPIPAFFIFKGQKGRLSFRSDFVLYRDECGCHVHKFAGPDTIVARL